MLLEVLNLALMLLRLLQAGKGTQVTPFAC